MTTEPGPSITARSVAAHRAGFERAPAPYGRPEDDRRLTEDVAAELQLGPESPLARYLRARTAFFDRVVTRAIGRGVTQMVSIGAGYDGRALRYGAPGVRWWEVDRAATQRDKLARLDRLGIDRSQVGFVEHDLADPGLADRLLSVGLQADAPVLFLAEGLLVYLTAERVDRLLGDLRTLVTPGTRLAVSVRHGRPTEARSRFEAAAIAVGEAPANDIDPDRADELLSCHRWASVDIGERARGAGLLMLRPVWAPPPRASARSVGRIASYLDRALGRRGVDRLPAHLAGVHGVKVMGMTELDVGVHRVALADGVTWVARLFPVDQPAAVAQRQAALLEALERDDFPAERLAAPAVSVHEGQAVLVTRWVAGRPPANRPARHERLGELLGRLHCLDPGGALASLGPGGGWHHLVAQGTVDDEINAGAKLLRVAEPRVGRDQREAYATLLGGLESVSLSADLPMAVVHPDPVLRNVIQPPGGSPVLIDWAGAGIGSRVGSLGALLWAAAAAGPGSVAAAITGYRRFCELQDAELASLSAAIAIRPLVLAAWTFFTGRGTLEQASEFWERHRRLGARAVRSISR